MAKLSAYKAMEKNVFPEWNTWPMGDPILGGNEWLEEQKKSGMLPSINFGWSNPTKAELRMAQKIVKVFWLDPDAKLQHEVRYMRVNDNILVANREEWEEALDQGKRK